MRKQKVKLAIGIRAGRTRQYSNNEYNHNRGIQRTDTEKRMLKRQSDCPQRSPAAYGWATITACRRRPDGTFKKRNHWACTRGEGACQSRFGSLSARPHVALRYAWVRSWSLSRRRSAICLATVLCECVYRGENHFCTIGGRSLRDRWLSRREGVGPGIRRKRGWSGVGRVSIWSARD